MVNKTKNMVAEVSMPEAAQRRNQMSKIISKEVRNAISLLFDIFNANKNRISTVNNPKTALKAVIIVTKLRWVSLLPRAFSNTHKGLVMP